MRFGWNGLIYMNFSGFNPPGRRLHASQRSNPLQANWTGERNAGSKQSSRRDVVRRFDSEATPRIVTLCHLNRQTIHGYPINPSHLGAIHTLAKTDRELRAATSTLPTQSVTQSGMTNRLTAYRPRP
jgi:hypothetical protein